MDYYWLLAAPRRGALTHDLIVTDFMMSHSTVCPSIVHAPASCLSVKGAMKCGCEHVQLCGSVLQLCLRSRVLESFYGARGAYPKMHR
mmetsp:Transcript_66118/g.107255  ORF Transcript_66118/g.107255 Transcript_66118/m.107255 type:complete len:88 (-) Transcript_66118:5-268(-)